MAELLIIEAMFVSRLRRRKYFVLRLIASLVIISVVVTFFPLRYEPLYNSLMFFLFFALSIVAIIFCFRDTFWNILFCSLAAYTVKHVAYLLYTVIVNVLTEEPGNIYLGDAFAAQSPAMIAVMIIVYFACYIMAYTEAYFLFVSMIPKNPDLQLGPVNMIVISGLVIIVDIVFNMYTVYNPLADKQSVFLEQVYNLIICLLVLQMQFQKLRQKRIMEEYDIIQKIHQQEQLQFKHLKDNINIINVKCHDLKHQLRLMRKNEYVDLEELKSVEQAISIYQTAAQTGNETLDIVLMDKLLYCDRNNINITCIADGRSISFMSEEDIYSLFGNALDNAITAVEKLSAPYREIKLVIDDKGDVVTIRIENKYQGKIKLEDGIPVTVKKDTRYHGFGMMSMQMIASKYNGKLRVELSGDDMFVLTVVFINGNEYKREESKL